MNKIKRLYRHTMICCRKYVRTIKGPPKKHGIPKDHEPIGLPASQRPYLHDYSLSLRPGRAYKPLAVHDFDQAFYRPQPLENPLELYND